MENKALKTVVKIRKIRGCLHRISTLAIPVAFKEEVWNLGDRLPRFFTGIIYEKMYLTTQNA